MNDMSTYMMTKEIDAHSAQIAALNKQVKTLKGQNTILGIGLAGAFAVALITIAEVALFEDKVDEKLNNMKKDDEIYV